MAPRLPLELQLRIIELAVPPLTRKRLPEIRSLMRSLPFVSRSWRSMAYAKIPVVPKLVLKWSTSDRVSIDAFARVVAGAGRAVERCELDLRTRWRPIESLCQLKGSLQSVRELWIDLPRCDTAQLTELASLRRLSVQRLTHLALREAWLPRFGGPFLNVDTLVLDQCSSELDQRGLLSFFPSLRVLALHNSPDLAEEILCGDSPCPPTLQHLLLSFVRGNLPLGYAAPLGLSASLKSVTLRHPVPSSSGRGTFVDRLPRACGITTVIKVITSDKDDSGFDVEAWALSFGS